jgi:hypothetical protein
MFTGFKSPDFLRLCRIYCRPKQFTARLRPTAHLPTICADSNQRSCRAFSLSLSLKGLSRARLQNNLDVRVDLQRGVYVDGTTEVVVGSKEVRVTSSQHAPYRSIAELVDPRSLNA